MTGLRQPGRATFYQIWWLNTDRDEWQHGMCVDWLGMQKDEMTSVNGFGYSASGRCWQETGHHGTYDAFYASELLRRVKEYKPEYQWKVVMVDISVKVADVPNPLQGGFCRHA